MPITNTARLGLAVIDDDELNWGAAARAGYQDADARVLLTGTVTDPNVSVQSHFVGQLYYRTNTSPPTVWIATAVGSPGTWVLFSQLVHGGTANAAITMAAALILNNAIKLQGKDSGAVARDLAEVDGANQVLLAGGAQGLVKVGGSGFLGGLELLVDSLANLKARTNALLARILTTADAGAGNGLDADLLDGVQGADYLGWSAGKYFQTSELTVGNGEDGAEAHGFGAVPRLVWAVLRCKTSDHGYNPNDEATVAAPTQVGSNTRGITFRANATDLRYAVANNGFYVQEPFVNGQYQFVSNPSRWRLLVRAIK